MIRSNRTGRHGGTAERAVSEELDAIKADLGRLREDMTAFCQAVVDAGKTELNDARSRVGHGAHQRVESLLQNLRSARDHGREAISQAEDAIEAKPLTSLMIAFAVGLFAGKWFIRE